MTRYVTQRWPIKNKKTQVYERTKCVKKSNILTTGGVFTQQKLYFEVLNITVPAQTSPNNSRPWAICFRCKKNISNEPLLADNTEVWHSAAEMCSLSLAMFSTSLTCLAHPFLELSKACTIGTLLVANTAANLLRKHKPNFSSNCPQMSTTYLPVSLVTYSLISTFLLSWFSRKLFQSRIDDTAQGLANHGPQCRKEIAHQCLAIAKFYML